MNARQAVQAVIPMEAHLPAVRAVILMAEVLLRAARRIPDFRQR